MSGRQIRVGWRLYQGGNNGQSTYMDQRQGRQVRAWMPIKEGPARQVGLGTRDPQSQRKHTRRHRSDPEGSLFQAESFAVVSVKPGTH